MVVCAGQLNPSLPSGLTLVQNFLLETKQIKKKKKQHHPSVPQRGVQFIIFKKRKTSHCYTYLGDLG